MAATLPPGIGNPQQASQATAFMRQQPWYQQLVSSWGLDPNNTDENGNLIDPATGKSAKLSDAQQQQLIAAARDSGIGISDSYSIDENGQIAKPDSHMLRNIAIAAGITGLALTGLGAAGIGPLSGAFGAGAGAGAGAGLGTAETVSPFAVGDLSATSLGLPVTAGLGTAGAVGAGGSTLAKIAGLLPDVGKGIGAATTAAGQNALNQEQLGLTAANTDISGQSAYTNEELAIAKENAALQNQQLKNQYMAEKAANPSVSPFDITGGPKYSPAYVSTLKTLAAQNPTLLAAPAPYKPITPSGAQAATGTTPSTLQKIGEIAGPVTTVLPSVLKLFR